MIYKVAVRLSVRIVAMIATVKARPILAAKSLGAWSIGFAEILKVFTVKSLSKLSKLYFPKSNARRAKSTNRNTAISHDFVNKTTTLSAKTHKAVSRTLFSLTFLKSTGHSNSKLKVLKIYLIYILYMLIIQKNELDTFLQGTFS